MSDDLNDCDELFHVVLKRCFHGFEVGLCPNVGCNPVKPTSEELNARWQKLTDELEALRK